MPEFTRFVRHHVAPLALSADREQKIVDEWSAQLEDLYDALRASGLAADEAWREVQRQVADGRALGDHLLGGEPLILRLAHAPQHPAA